MKKRNVNLKHGETWNVFDPDYINDEISIEDLNYTTSNIEKINENIFNANEVGNYNITYYYKNANSHKEKLEIRVTRKNHVRPKGKIFHDSNIVNGDLYLDELHKITEEISRLNYKDYPLISTVSLRVVLEDLLKKECEYSNLPLKGSLEENFKTVLDSFESRFINNRDNSQELKKLKSELKGHNPLKSLLQNWKKDANYYSNLLNLLTHNPTGMIDSNRIYNIANEVLVPLGHLISSARKKGL